MKIPREIALNESELAIIGGFPPLAVDGLHGKISSLS
jgi:hypothetical protein